MGCQKLAAFRDGPKQSGGQKKGLLFPAETAARPSTRNREKNGEKEEIGERKVICVRRYAKKQDPLFFWFSRLCENSRIGFFFRNNQDSVLISANRREGLGGTSPRPPPSLGEI